MPVSLGMPSAPPPVLAPRRTTRQIQVGSVGVGSQHPVSVQSMTTTKTHDIGATLQQIAELTAAGCDIVRVACPTDKDAEALKVIAQQSTIPVIADIHFQPKYVFAAIEAGCGAVRVNPGNIKKFDDKVKEIAQAASDHGTSLRIGVNAGSLDPRLLKKYGKATDVVWTQEEPQNQGAWYQIRHHLQFCLADGQNLHYAGRARSASPAAGHMADHVREQQQLVADALVNPFNDTFAE